jgi:DNA-binding NarL/FixJ family response regulator
MRSYDFSPQSQASVGTASFLKHPGLSERELEVLQLIVQGMSNREIGTELTISLNTVARHVSNIFDKLGAANRTQAAAFAFRLLLAG